MSWPKCTQTETARPNRPDRNSSDRNGQKSCSVCSMLTCSKNTLFRAYCMPMYACQLWSKYKQTNETHMSCLQQHLPIYALHIPRNTCFRPHQVNHYSMSGPFFFFWASCWNHCLAALDLGAGVEQPFNCLIVQNREACSPWRGRWIGHWRTTWSTVCSSASHSQAAEEAIV